MKLYLKKLVKDKITEGYEDRQRVYAHKRAGLNKAALKYYRENLSLAALATMPPDLVTVMRAKRG